MVFLLHSSYISHKLYLILQFLSSLEYFSGKMYFITINLFLEYVQKQF